MEGIGEARNAAGIKVGSAGRRGAFAIFAPGAGSQALLRKGALGVLVGQLDFARDVLTIRNHGVDIPLEVNEMGHYVRSVVTFRKGPSYIDQGPRAAASYFEWAILDTSPDMSNAGLDLPFSEGGVYRS